MVTILREAFLSDFAVAMAAVGSSTCVSARTLLNSLPVALEDGWAARAPKFVGGDGSDEDALRTAIADQAKNGTLPPGFPATLSSSLPALGVAAKVRLESLVCWMQQAGAAEGCVDAAHPKKPIVVGDTAPDMYAADSRFFCTSSPSGAKTWKRALPIHKISLLGYLAEAENLAVMPVKTADSLASAAIPMHVLFCVVSAFRSAMAAATGRSA